MIKKRDNKPDWPYGSMDLPPIPGRVPSGNANRGPTNKDLLERAEDAVVSLRGIPLGDSDTIALIQALSTLVIARNMEYPRTEMETHVITGLKPSVENGF